MADIELVIKMPEEMYNWVNDVNKFSNDYGASDFIDLVKNGAPLPKGHGDLIDKKEVYKKFYCRCLARVAKEVLEEIPTIIQADRSDEE